MNFSDNYNNIIQITEDLSNYSLTELNNILKRANELYSEYENLQLIVKRDSNSLYGVSASIYYSLADFDVAEDITTSGKQFCCIVDYAINNFLVNWGEKELNIIKEFYPQVVKLRRFTEYKAYTKNDVCVYGDTDSRYIDLGFIYSLMLLENNSSLNIPESDDELANFATFLFTKFFKDLIKKTIDDYCELTNARKGFMKMSHEVTARKSIFRKKKKYILTMIWKDGKKLNKPKIKYQGVEIKQGTMSPRAKKILSKLLDKYLLEGYNNDMLRIECLKLINYIKTKREKDFLYQISSVSGLENIRKNNLGKYVSDKNHIQMQILLSWINFIHDNNLQSEYKFPFEGQKMNYYYCDENSGIKVIGVPDDVNINKVPFLPEPDWNKMINSCLIKPLLKYILEKDEIDDVDANNFLMGVKQIKLN